MSVYQARRAICFGAPLMVLGFYLCCLSATQTRTINSLTMIGALVMLAGVAAIAWKPRREEDEPSN